MTATTLFLARLRTGRWACRSETSQDAPSTLPLQDVRRVEAATPYAAVVAALVDLRDERIVDGCLRAVEDVCAHAAEECTNDADLELALALSNVRETVRSLRKVREASSALHLELDAHGEVRPASSLATFARELRGGANPRAAARTAREESKC